MSFDIPASWTEESARDTLQQIIQRATADAEFRRLCLADPAAAVRQATGRALPPGFRLHLVDNAGADLTVVLPDPAGAAELSDADLEAVAGGNGKGNQCAVSEYCGVSKGPNPQPKPLK